MVSVQAAAWDACRGATGLGIHVHPKVTHLRKTRMVASPDPTPHFNISSPASEPALKHASEAGPVGRVH